MEDDLLLAHDDRVPRIVAALEADDHVRIFGQEIDNFPLALVPPLHADNYDVGHCCKTFLDIFTTEGTESTEKNNS